jgi:hypothetical protein
MMKPLAGSVSVEAVYCDHETVVTVWPKVKHYIQRAFDRADIGRFDELEADLFKNYASLWLAMVNGEIHGAVITQVYLTEKSKVCMVQAAGGSGLNNWLGLLPTIEAYARTMKCDCVRFWGRKGWARVVKGYIVERVMMERRL